MNIQFINTSIIMLHCYNSKIQTYLYQCLLPPPPPPPAHPNLTQTRRHVKMIYLNYLHI